MSDSNRAAMDNRIAMIVRTMIHQEGVEPRATWLLRCWGRPPWAKLVELARRREAAVRIQRCRAHRALLRPSTF